MMVRQNKWRAARFGSDSRLVHARDYSVQPVSEIATRLVDRLRGVAVELGCETELLYVKEIVQAEGWSQRQRGILQATGEPSEIVRQLSEQSRISDFGAISS
jgi:carboxylate-amine ligase